MSTLFKVSAFFLPFFLTFLSMLFAQEFALDKSRDYFTPLPKGHHISRHTFPDAIVPVPTDVSCHNSGSRPGALFCTQLPPRRGLNSGPPVPLCLEVSPSHSLPSPALLARTRSTDLGAWPTRGKSACITQLLIYVRTELGGGH